MTILHVDTGRQMRGGQHQVRLLMNGLRLQGHECLLLARPRSPLEQWAAGAEFSRFPATLRELWRLSGAADVVHAHDARAHSMASVACRQRFVVSRRVAFPVKHSVVSKWKYRRPSRYLAVSQWVAGELVKAGVPVNRVDVVFDAVEENPCPVAWSPQNPVVAPAFSGDPGKLCSLTREACRIARAELLLSDNLPRDLQRASAFVYLTKSEGLGSAALLAMEAGVPVIASRVEGLAEVFTHDRSGLYVSSACSGLSGDACAKEAAACIRRVLQEPGLAARLIAGARARVRERFGLAELVERTLESYGRALGG